MTSSRLKAKAHLFPAGGWRDRNELWRGQVRAARPQRVRASRPETLILCGHGVHLSVDGGALLVRNGRTHSGHEPEVRRFFRGDRLMPSRIIVLDGSGSITFDVISWLAEQAIPLIRISWEGEAVSIVGGSGTALDANRVAWQIATYGDEEGRLDFCRRVIRAKLKAAENAMRTAVPASEERTKAIAVSELLRGRLQSGAGENVRDILTMEARAAAAYFLAWRGLPLRWRGLKARPVPAEWMTVDVRRSQPAARKWATNRNATHPVNAMLNYAYAVLHSQVQIAAVAAGFDPRRGIMHEARMDSFALVLDVMEPLRPAIDAAVLCFAAANAFTAADFTIRTDGVCRLAPQLARRVAQITSDTTQASLDARAVLDVIGFPG